MIGSTRSFDKQTRVIQIAMNSIENQSPQKLEMKKTCIGMAVAHSRQVHHSQVWDPEFIHAKSNAMKQSRVDGLRVQLWQSRVDGSRVSLTKVMAFTAPTTDAKVPLKGTHWVRKLHWTALIGCRILGDIGNFYMKFSWAGSRSPAHHMQIIHIAGRLGCNHNWGD